MTLNEFFKENPKTALAFSGGVDSSYLLYAARQAGAEVHAYYVKTAFQPEFEYEDAMGLAKQLGAQVTVLRLNALSDPQVAANPANRCYYCKQNIFGNIWRAARADGFTVLLDGTNASDQARHEGAAGASGPLPAAGGRADQGYDPGEVPGGRTLHLE